MPWTVKKSGRRWVVVKDADGKVVGTHPTRDKAVRHQRALYANTANERRGK
jgi:hypothetical protein